MRNSQSSRSLRIVCSLVVLSLAGCAELKQWKDNGFKVGPDYRKPAAPVASEWIDFNDPGVISENHAVNEAAWWESLNDPVLDGLVNQAYQQNLSLRAAGMRVLEAQAQRAIAAGLLYPQFQEGFASLNHIQLGTVGNAAGIGAVPFRSFDLWSSGFNVGWEMDVWGKFRRNLESADANLDASIENHDDVLVCLIAETAAAYTEMRAFQQRLEYAQSNVDIQQESLELAQSRFKNGASGKLDVTQATSNLAQTKALIPVLAKGLRLANNRLCVLLGTPPRDLQSELGVGSIPVAPAQLVVGIPADLIRRRPDVRREERRVAEQSARIGIAKADLFPAFTINGSINWQANQFSDMFTSAANAGFINPAFHWNILNYGRIRNNVLAQEAGFQEVAIQYQDTVLRANAEVEDGITGFLNAHQQVAALREGVEASEESVKLALIQYREGAVDFNRVFNLQTILVQQQDDLATAEAEITLSLIRTYKALGGGWQIRFGRGASGGAGQAQAVPVLAPPEVLDADEVGIQDAPDVAKEDSVDTKTEDAPAPAESDEQ
ncbi:MAG TPA: efflux transporter outer membrane subunit [Planctomycetes bacterium]|nr:efflux transporter outer membrane subunit [Fuerstiella sp.]HIK91372.1 efflux transporter outer membrane subunit [Planctomycetota bacterium]